MFKFSGRSLRNLAGVKPELVEVAQRALELTTQDFTVVEGLRSLEKQREYFAKGASKTMNSKHLRQADGFSHAVDLYPYFNGSVQVHADKRYFEQVADAMKRAAEELGVRITWGGDWDSFVDMPHYQYEGKL